MLHQALLSEDAAATTAAFATLLQAADRFAATHRRAPGAPVAAARCGCVGGWVGACRQAGVRGGVWPRLACTPKLFHTACGWGETCPTIGAPPRPPSARCALGHMPAPPKLGQPGPPRCHAPLRSAAELEGDASALLALGQSLLGEAGIGGVRLPDDAAAEMCRWASCEPHAMAAIVGSIGSQEAIKLLTGQFVPVEGTLYYNAVHCCSLVL